MLMIIAVQSVAIYELIKILQAFFYEKCYSSNTFYGFRIYLTSAFWLDCNFI